MKKKAPFKSGFVAIIGAPNVGKSTLLNRLLGQKIAITSEKPQTTRHRILGVAHLPGAQMVFLDTPGIHRARGALNVRMVGNEQLGDVHCEQLGDVHWIIVCFYSSRLNPYSSTIFRPLMQVRLFGLCVAYPTFITQKNKP